MAIFGSGSIGTFFGGPGAGSRTASGFSVSMINGVRVQELLGDIEKGMRRESNAELRNAAKEIAKSLIPSIKAFAAMSPMPIARSMADTARAKSDRLPVVQIGGVNPSLRGFKKGVGIKRASSRTQSLLKGGRPGTSKNYRTTLAWASERGPYPGSVYNRFKVPRRESGYYVAPAINANLQRAVAEYSKAIERVITTYGASR